MTDEELFLLAQGVPPFGMGAGYATPAAIPMQYDNTGRNVDPSLLAQQLILGQPAAGMQAIPQASQQFSRPSYQPLMTPETYQNFYANNRPAASIYSPLEVPRFKRYVEPVPVSASFATPVNRVVDGDGGYDNGGGYSGGFDSASGADIGAAPGGGISMGVDAGIGGPGGNIGGPADISASPDAGAGGPSGNSSCVIATHAVAHGSFTPREKKRAVVWCTRTLHNKWWGEVIRNGYRYHGNKAITAGEAHEYYDEFRDFIRFATGAKRNAKTAKVFAWRSVQFFFTGLFLKGH